DGLPKLCVVQHSVDELARAIARVLSHVLSSSPSHRAGARRGCTTNGGFASPLRPAGWSGPGGQTPLPAALHGPLAPLAQPPNEPDSLARRPKGGRVRRAPHPPPLPVWSVPSPRAASLRSLAPRAGGATSRTLWVRW